MDVGTVKNRFRMISRRRSATLVAASGEVGTNSIRNDVPCSGIRVRRPPPDGRNYSTIPRNATAPATNIAKLINRAFFMIELVPSCGLNSLWKVYLPCGSGLERLQFLPACIKLGQFFLGGGQFGEQFIGLGGVGAVKIRRGEQGFDAR